MAVGEYSRDTLVPALSGYIVSKPAFERFSEEQPAQKARSTSTIALGIQSHKFRKICIKLRMSTIQPNIEQPVSEEMQLVRRAKRGDDSAFEELVRRYDRNVFRIAQHITQNREDAEDVVQEAFLKAYGNLAQVSGAVEVLYLAGSDCGK